MTTQKIRSSQLITTYGPGAIIEAPGGPGVMRDIEGSGVFSGVGLSVTDFEISDIRLSKRLGSVGLLRIPTNSEIGVPDENGIYACIPFPDWSLCVPHDILYKYDDRYGGCPNCPKMGSGKDRARSRSEAVPFVLACPDGHLDDIPWNRLIDHRSEKCPQRFLSWVGGGSSLRNVDIQCPECRLSVNMGDVYRNSHPCSGRQPELGADRPGCSTRARVLQRNAANLRMVNTATSLTIRPNETVLHRILGTTVVSAVLVTNKPRSKSDLIVLLEELVRVDLMKPGLVTQVDSYPELEVTRAIVDSLGVRLSEAQMDDQFRLAELIQLERAAIEGAPPSDRQSQDPPLFEVVRTAVRSITGPGGYTLRVTPVSRLMVTMAQIGYRRIDPVKSNSVEVQSRIQGRDWVPAVQISGEGIFVDVEPKLTQQENRNNIEGLEVSAWLRRWGEDLDESLAWMSELGHSSTHPLTVWWHTLSHSLITSISLDSGYSAAALKERIYTNLDPLAGPIRGGVLIFTAQPGGDGTLGGLIETSNRFEDVLKRAIHGIEHCSNDPLCSQRSISDGSGNGAACYACLFVSETSCEMRNLYLDRNLLRENLP